MKFAIFGLTASVDIKPLPGAWAAELLGLVLGVQDHKKIKFPLRVYSSLAAEGLRLLAEKNHDYNMTLMELMELALSAKNSHAQLTPKCYPYKILEIT